MKTKYELQEEIAATEQLIDTCENENQLEELCAELDHLHCQMDMYYP